MVAAEKTEENPQSDFDPNKFSYSLSPLGGVVPS